MTKSDSYFEWMVANWAKASLPIGVLLLLLAPFLRQGLSREAFLVFLLLPVYMFHQFEEHADGQFKAFVDKNLGGGKSVLSNTDIFWINILAVWMADIAVLYLSVYAGIVWGLVAVYLMLFNALVHIVTSLVKRIYNPGLWTGIFLFLPVGGYAAYVLTRANSAGFLPHGLALLAAILVHAGIVLYARRKISLTN